MDFKIPEMLKFGIMLLVYTFYMAWWASHINTQLDNLAQNVKAHTDTGNHPMHQTNAIVALSKVQEKQAAIFEQLNQDHVRCKIILELVQERIKILEEDKI